MKRILAQRRRGEKTPRPGKKLALTALVLLFILSACAARRSDAPKYTAAQIARDLLVGEQTFLKTSEGHHGAECRSGCTLPTIQDGKLCVKICNWIKGADIARDFLAAALDAHCAGPGYLEGTAPCGAGAANETELTQRTKEFRDAMADLRAADKDSHD